MSDSKTVAIVEDDPAVATLLEMLCEDAGATVLGTADTAEKALDLVRTGRPDYVLMDVRLRGMADGVDVANEMQADLPSTKVVYITGSNEKTTIARIKSDHPYRILIKPVDPDQLTEALS